MSHWSHHKWPVYSSSEEQVGTNQILFRQSCSHTLVALQSARAATWPSSPPIMSSTHSTGSHSLRQCCHKIISVTINRSHRIQCHLGRDKESHCYPWVRGATVPYKRIMWRPVGLGNTSRYTSSHPRKLVPTLLLLKALARASVCTGIVYPYCKKLRIN